jgi:hypothetical protein
VVVVGEGVVVVIVSGVVVDSGIEVVGGVVVDCAPPQDTISSIVTKNIVINNNENDLAIFTALLCCFKK